MEKAHYISLVHIGVDQAREGSSAPSGEPLEGATYCYRYRGVSLIE